MERQTRYNRDIDWKGWKKMFKSAECLEEKLDAAADMVYEAWKNKWRVVNVTHYDTDGYCAAKCLQLALRNPDCEHDNFWSFQEIKNAELSHSAYNNIRNHLLKEGGAMIISTDLRMTGMYCKKLDDLQMMLDVPLLSLDHHKRTKRRRKNRADMEDEFIDTFEDGYGVHDWDIEEKKVRKQPFLDIDSESYIYPATLLVYHVIGRAAERHKDYKPDMKKIIPFAAIGIMGDKADINVKEKDSELESEIYGLIGEAFKLSDPDKLSKFRDYLDMIGYALPKESSSIWGALSETDDLNELLDSKNIISNYGDILALERKKIVDNFWITVSKNKLMNRLRTYESEVERSTIDLDDYPHEALLAVPAANFLGETYPECFFAIWEKQKREDAIGDEPPFEYVIHLRRGDGKRNMAEVMEYMICDNFNDFETPPKIKGGGPTGDVILYSEDDLNFALRKFTEKCESIRTAEEDEEQMKTLEKLWDDPKKTVKKGK